VNKLMAKAIRPVLQECLEKHLDLSNLDGCVVEVKSAKYDNATVTFQVAITPGGSAAMEQKTRDEFLVFAHLFDLKPDDLGKEFTSGRETYTVVGLDMKRRKFPIRCRRADGEIRLFTREVARLIHGNGHA
jgi:hypothetical protein